MVKPVMIDTVVLIWLVGLVTISEFTHTHSGISLYTRSDISLLYTYRSGISLLYIICISHLPGWSEQTNDRMLISQTSMAVVHKYMDFR